MRVYLQSQSAMVINDWRKFIQLITLCLTDYGGRDIFLAPVLNLKKTTEG